MSGSSLSVATATEAASSAASSEEAASDESAATTTGAETDTNADESQTTAATTTAATTTAATTTASIPANSSFEVHYLDVGQGDCALIICDGEAMIIDGGPASASSKVYSYLKSNKIKTIKYMLCTHPEADHVGGLSGALNFASVERAFCSAASYDTKTFKSFLKYLKGQSVSLEVPVNKTKLQLGSASITIYNPDSFDSGNNDSLVVRATYGSYSFLFMGDAGTEEENELMSMGVDLSADVIKIGHHGSKTSTGKKFLAVTNASIAVISVGADNSYGHPTETVLSRIKNAGLTLYRTDLNGDIVMKCDNNTIDITTDKKATDVFTAGAAASSDTKATATTKKSSDNSNSNSTNTTYVGNKNTKKFHYADCSSVSKMKDKNKKYSDSRDYFINKGYSPCKICNP